MIRDRLVCGERSPKIQQRLLAVTELSFDRALKIASATERAEKNVYNIEASIGLKKMEGLNKVQEKCNKCEKWVVRRVKIVFVAGVIIFKVNSVLKCQML